MWDTSMNACIKFNFLILLQLVINILGAWTHLQYCNLLDEKWIPRFRADFVKCYQKGKLINRLHSVGYTSTYILNHGYTPYWGWWIKIWPAMLTFSPILAQKVDFISKREQNQDGFFPGDILKIYIIGLNLKRKSSQNFHMVRTSILVNWKPKIFAFWKEKQ